jgi:hypothetical protein
MDEWGDGEDAAKVRSSAMDLTLPRGMAYLGRASQRPTNFEYFRTVNPAAGEFYAHDYEGFDAHGCL